MSQDKTELTRQKALANAKEHLFPRLKIIFNRSNTNGPVTPLGQRRAYLLLLEAYRLGVTPQDVEEYIKNQFPDKASNYLQQFKNFTNQQQQQITNRHIQYARYAQQAKLSPIDNGAFAKLQEALEKENKNGIKEAYFKLRYLDYSPELIYRLSSISMEEIARLENTSTLRVKSLFDSFNGFTINPPLSEHGTLLQRAIATKNLNDAKKMIAAGALPQSLDELNSIASNYQTYQGSFLIKRTKADALESIKTNIIDVWNNISQPNKKVLKELDKLSKKPYLEEVELDRAWELIEEIYYSKEFYATEEPNLLFLTLAANLVKRLRISHPVADYQTHFKKLKEAQSKTPTTIETPDNKLEESSSSNSSSDAHRNHNQIDSNEFIKEQGKALWQSRIAIEQRKKTLYEELKAVFSSAEESGQVKPIKLSMKHQIIYQKILQWQSLGTHIREIINHIPSIKEFLIHVTKRAENLMDLYKEHNGVLDTGITSILETSVIYLKEYLNHYKFYPEYRNANGETVLTVMINTNNFHCAKHLIEAFKLKVTDINDYISITQKLSEKNTKIRKELLTMIQPENEEEKQILSELTDEILTSNGRELDSSIIANVVGKIKKLQAPSPQFITLVCDGLRKLKLVTMAENLENHHLQSNAHNNSETTEMTGHDSDDDISSNSNSNSSSSYSVVMNDNSIASNSNGEDKTIPKNEMATNTTNDNSHNSDELGFVSGATQLVVTEEQKKTALEEARAQHKETEKEIFTL